MLAIEIEGLTKSFGTKVAVNNVSLRVAEGSVYAFLGPNGAGKTTTLRMLSGLAKPRTGSIKIRGVNVCFGRANFQHLIGYLPDDPVFYDWMTAPEYLCFVGRLFGLCSRDAARKSELLLPQVGLGEIRRRIGTFSRGMKKRLGIAQALVSDPEVLIFDEPLAALDPLGRQEVFEILQALQKRSTIIFSTHILDDAKKICDHVGILNEGELIADTSMEELQKQSGANLIRIEVRDSRSELKAALLETAWVQRVEERQEFLEVRVSDLARAQKEIPGTLHHRGLALDKFEIVERDLEDFFMELLGGRKHDGRADSQRTA